MIQRSLLLFLFYIIFIIIKIYITFNLFYDYYIKHISLTL